MPEATIKGFLLKGIVKAIRKQCGEEGVDEFEKVLGIRDFKPFAEYTDSFYRKVVDTSCNILYGTNNGEAMYKLGRLIFESNIPGTFVRTVS